MADNKKGQSAGRLSGRKNAMILEQREDSFRATFAGDDGLLPRFEVYHWNRQRCVELGTACLEGAQARFPEDFPTKRQPVTDAVLGLLGVTITAGQVLSAVGMMLA